MLRGKWRELPQGLRCLRYAMFVKSLRHIGRLAQGRLIRDRHSINLLVWARPYCREGSHARLSTRINSTTCYDAASLSELRLAN
jgi:hypothetical protein